MAYLHAREYYDEAVGAMQRCILHRDVKVLGVATCGISIMHHIYRETQTLTPIHPEPFTDFTSAK